MPLYTLVVDYLGGTYISQVRAESPARAMSEGIRNLDTSNIAGMGETMKERLCRALTAGGEPTAIRDLENVWCSTPSNRGKLALLTLIKTDTSPTGTDNIA